MGTTVEMHGMGRARSSAFAQRACSSARGPGTVSLRVALDSLESSVRVQGCAYCAWREGWSEIREREEKKKEKGKEKKIEKKE